MKAAKNGALACKESRLLRTRNAIIRNRAASPCATFVTFLPSVQMTRFAGATRQRSSPPCKRGEEEQPRRATYDCTPGLREGLACGCEEVASPFTP
jgi:hypothetical protein